MKKIASTYTILLESKKLDKSYPKLFFFFYINHLFRLTVFKAINKILKYITSENLL